MTDARRISDQLTEAMNARDADRLASLFAEDATFTDPSGEYRGRDAIRGYWQTFFTAFPDMQGEDEVKLESDDTAFNEWSVRGTHTGPLETPEGTIEATNRQMFMRGCDVVIVRNGEITSQRAYYDQLGMMAQLGLVPEGALAG